MGGSEGVCVTTKTRVGGSEGLCAKGLLAVLGGACCSACRKLLQCLLGCHAYTLSKQPRRSCCRHCRCCCGYHYPTARVLVLLAAAVLLHRPHELVVVAPATRAMPCLLRRPSLFR